MGPDPNQNTPLESDAYNDGTMSHRNRNEGGKSFLTQKLGSFEAAAKVTSSLNVNRNPPNKSAVS